MADNERRFTRKGENFATLPTDEIGDDLIRMATQYYEYLNTTGRIDIWRNSYKNYHFGYWSKGEVLNHGDQNEKRKLNINHFRSLLEHIKVLTTDQRPSFDPRAINSDQKSLSQTVLAKGLLDYYMRQKNLEEVLDSCLDYALQAGEGYVFQEWDDTLGEVVAQSPEEESMANPDEQSEEVMEDEQITEENEEEDEEDTEDVKTTVRREGDIRNYALHPINVIRDFTKESVEDDDWYIIRRLVNRYELIAKYPDFEDEILLIDRSNKLDISSRYDRSIFNWDNDNMFESDLIYLYTFRYKKTAALPEGRQVEFIESGDVLYDGILPYKDLSIYRLLPSKQQGSNFGYSPAFDLLAIQEALFALDSTIITNQNAFGVQSITSKKGSGVSVSEIGNGLALVEYNGENPPAPLNLLSTPAEIFTYREDLIRQMETISGVNSVSRGNPQNSLESGAALALVQSMAIQFNSGLQNSYVKMLERVGTGTLNLLKEYADSPRVALIAGISKKPYLKEFSGKDIELIDRVIVDVGNPLSKTIAGRVSVADTLLERGMLESPDQYIQVLNSGNLDPILEGKAAEQINIRSENEALYTGEEVQVLITDNHQLHILEHKNVLASPDARKDPTIVQSALSHIEHHINILRTGDPGILMLLGQQPLQPETPAMPQNVPDTPNQGAAPGGDGGQVSPPAPGAEGAKLPNMPNMPKNPMTNNQFDTQTGGL